MTDLRTVHVPTARNHTASVIAAVVVLLGVGAVGAYSYKSGMWNGPPKQVVSDSQLPSPGLPLVAPNAK